VEAVAVVQDDLVRASLLAAFSMLPFLPNAVYPRDLENNCQYHAVVVCLPSQKVL
jgi:hypothetical protein